jgi:hypothetical protein
MRKSAPGPQAPAAVIAVGVASCLAVSATAACGCASAPSRQPPGAPPTATSISRSEPGGDANDPHEAALTRLAQAPWGWRNDKQDVLHVPMPDWENWKRIRYFGIPSFVGFRYGDDHHAVLAVWIRPADGPNADPASCLTSFEAWGNPTVRSFDVEIGPSTTTTGQWAGGAFVSRSVDAEINSILSHKKYAAAYAAYLMWPGFCTIFGVAVPIRDAADLAHAARDRYVNEGFGHMVQMAKSPPEL